MEPSVSEKLKKELAQATGGIQDPEIIRLRMAEKLTDDAGSAVLSDLTENEITTIALYRALNSHLISTTCKDGIPSIMLFLDEVIRLRASKNRMSRNEMVAILKAHSTANYYGGAMGQPGQAEQKPGFFASIFKRGGQ